MKDVYQVKEESKDISVSVTYSRPKLLHRVLANVVDFFILLVAAISLFFGARSIVQSTPYYKSAMKRMDEIQLNSGLYIRKGASKKVGDNYDIIYFIDNNVRIPGSDLEGKEESDIKTKNGLASKAINTFIQFVADNSSSEEYEEIKRSYDQKKLETVVDDIHLYLKDGDKIVPNPTYSEVPSKKILYYDNVFKPFIEKTCMPFLVTGVPEYKKLSKVDFNFLVFLEIPVALVLAAFLTYFVPPLFFKRGRKTLGKALYHIGTVDARLLSPTFWRFLAKTMIIIFGELILSLVTLGIPYIISFTLMTFSKNKQTFPDYMLNLYEVDTSKANIYMDYVEAQLKNELHGEPIDFKMKKPL